MIIDITKKYRYRNGEPARILCVVAPGNHPVVAMNIRGDITRHTESGIGRSISDGELVEIKEEKRLEFWVNINKSGVEGKAYIGGMDYTSKEHADKHSSVCRIACKHVVIEYFEGEGLEEKAQLADFSRV